jgi:hypothetical protein
MIVKEVNELWSTANSPILLSYFQSYKNCIYFMPYFLKPVFEGTACNVIADLEFCLFK